MKVLIIRNLKLFFRDRSAVFFSLLAVLIIIALYAVFLGDVWLDDSMEQIANAKVLMNSWLTAGLLAVASVTTTMGAFSIMINDQVGKINKDFYSSPIKRSGVAGGYIGSAFLIGVIISVIAFAATEIYTVIIGGDWPDFITCVKVFGLMLFATVTNTSMVCFIVSFIKSQSAYTALSTITGTLIGFLTGIYLPIGSLPDSVQTIIKVFPVSHAAALFRQALMEAPMRSAFEGIPSVYQEGFMEYMGIIFKFGDYKVSPAMSMLVLIITSVAFYGLSLINFRRRKFD